MKSQFTGWNPNLECDCCNRLEKDEAPIHIMAIPYGEPHVAPGKEADTVTLTNQYLLLYLCKDCLLSNLEYLEYFIVKDDANKVVCLGDCDSSSC